MRHYLYLLIDLGCILVPFLFSFYRPRAFYKEWKCFFPANLFVAILFVFWDVHFTQIGVWGFNPDYLSGLYLFNLPVEEVLFFICIPYACTFTFFALNYIFPKNALAKYIPGVNLLLVLLLFVLGVRFWDRWYTATSLLSLAAFLLYCQIRKVDLSNEYRAYIAILPFFFASNGILTGSFLEKPIVWYNDLENMGIRMGTIPVEDTFYGFLLILLNIRLYLWCKGRFSKRTV
ncbi:lycopene cyclase domain-containing protein [Marinilongibacter aquaticus]|uniref:lycopene cyclase domain-containing protein n=1 Tax=Marinilongibacter aquaticus TaxID=2975157 RepID=UPI0021BD5F0D|nr:lycopene cyclase domain-containing protein [Marinilongibacter aquaticus]UBM58896.1 lycopene cyclase domain-containing protein [Marinilongibacter aquaticus]